MAKDRRRSVEGGVGCGVGGKTMIICLANYAQFLVAGTRFKDDLLLLHECNNATNPQGGLLR
jgi:hypothetical protein